MPTSQLDKPAKPYDNFPLFAHKNGQWAKTIRGKHHYFGAWSDPQAAEAEFHRVEDDLRAGRKPSRGGELTVMELVNHFLTFKKGQVASGEISQGTFDDYYENCERVMKVFGKSRAVENLDPLDFQKLRANFAKTHGPTTLYGDIACTRALFNYCDKTFRIRPNYGMSFTKPSKTVLRKHRKARESRMYTPVELRKIIRKAEPQLRAMIYLGLNCGFGNKDCAMLTPKVIDFKGKWVDYARAKTGIDRRCPLWPETVAAIKQAIADRPKPSIECDNIFVTKYGNVWTGGRKGLVLKDDPITKEFTKVLELLDLKRPGVSFYALRHICYTVGKRHDKEAARAIMGHVENSNDMGVFYDEDEQPVDDQRLRAVSNHVRKWLTGKS